MLSRVRHIHKLVEYGGHRLLARMAVDIAPLRLDDDQDWGSVINDSHTMKKIGRVSHHVQIRETSIDVVDFEGSVTVPIVKKELEKDIYGIENIGFTAGDVAIDIGAHVGLFSIYLAKKHPDISIYAFEPIPESYAHLLTNIERNNVSNIVPFNFAITADGRDFKMSANFADNSGGATGHLKDMSMKGHWHYVVPSSTLEDVFKDHEIKHCRLLKIDCEGTEYEILHNSPSCLERTDYLSGEFHINDHLLNQGYSVEELLTHCGKYIPSQHLAIKSVRMAE